MNDKIGILKLWHTTNKLLMTWQRNSKMTYLKHIFLNQKLEESKHHPTTVHHSICKLKT